MSLVVWIAIKVKHISGILAYMDDAFSFDASTTLEFYPPHQTFYPPKQAKLLSLWDELGILHDPQKQVYGSTLTIIGFHINPNRMEITLPQESLVSLVNAIYRFHDTPDRRQPLREWQRLLGWLNWALNVQPLLRPALQSSYGKISRKQISHAGIYLNARVKHDLTWLSNMLLQSEEVFIVQSTAWQPHQADLVIYCDACLTGMGFWSPKLQQAFVADVTSSLSQPEDTIFWLEALTVLSALIWATELSPPPSRLAIFTDNLNTIQMFGSLRFQPPYDLLLLEAVAILTRTKIDLRVWHISGASNLVADALSRGLLAMVQQMIPAISISTFQPPRNTLGVFIQ